MSDEFPHPLYYPGLKISDMEALLRADYLTASGWLESAKMKLAQRAGEPIPWLTYGAIEFLERELSKEQSLYEFGGGQSTLYWAKYLSRVVSVDHDPVFAADVKARLAPNAEMSLIEENAPLSDALTRLLPELPYISDPERSLTTLRSGQLNGTFQQYALSILEYPPDLFDVVLIDGMARTLSTWSAIKYFKHKGFIVFDNSDRDFYNLAYDFLNRAGYRRMDFWGMGPVNPYKWCTSVFYKPDKFLDVHWFKRDKGPLIEQSSKENCEIIKTFGIAVIGFNRPFHLQAVLESLRLQGCIEDVHVWIDGTQYRGEYVEANVRSIEIAKRYKLKALHVQRSHLGIEKLMLDIQEYMSIKYDRVLILEDDCFPIEGAISIIKSNITDIENNAEIYSIYGHHFGVEHNDNLNFSRFQGWGWAAHSFQIRRLLPALRELFLMDEESYIAYIESQLTQDIRDKLAVTPGRDVLDVLRSFFSWDSATAFLTAKLGLQHRRTAVSCIANTGIVSGIGHFRDDAPKVRAPPFNMITIDEAWACYDRSTEPCDYSKDSYGLDGLDRIIMDHIPQVPGFFIEVGAYDGVTQSNSVLLEAAGWRGLLIEPNPSSYAKVMRSRPNALVEHAACVGFNFSGNWTTITDVGLMSVTSESLMDDVSKIEWLSRGESFAGRPRQIIDVPATTISALLDKHAIDRIDLLILDVEGAEIEVLSGIDFYRHAPAQIIAEDAYDDRLKKYLENKGYIRSGILMERKFTRDAMYVRVKK